ncbi:MAG: type II secretion system F family protein [Planctomycetaceae bacterium]
MLPNWLFYIAYAVAGIVALAAAGRIVLRRRRERALSQRIDAAVPHGESAVETRAAEAPAAEPRRVETVPPRDRSWSMSAKLLHSDAAELDGDADVPRVEADEVPALGTADYVLGPLTPTLAALLPDTSTGREALKGELRNAGYYQPHAWHNLAALRYMGVMLTLVLFGVGLLFIPPEFEIPWLIAMVIVPMLIWALPRVLIRGKAKDRVAEIELGMPDMLDMLHMCVSQGLTVPASLKRIGRELQPVYPALAQELAIVSDQAEIGTLEQSLTNFSKRVDVPDVHSFTSLIVQTERMGTSVGAALGEYSDGMRETLRQRADTKANQSTFKLLFPTVLCLMPAVYLFLLGPAIVEFSDFMAGDAIPEYQQNIQAIQPMTTDVDGI